MTKEKEPVSYIEVLPGGLGNLDIKITMTLDEKRAIELIKQIAVWAGVSVEIKKSKLDE